MRHHILLTAFAVFPSAFACPARRVTSTVTVWAPDATDTAAASTSSPATSTTSKTQPTTTESPTTLSTSTKSSSAESTSTPAAASTTPAAAAAAEATTTTSSSSTPVAATTSTSSESSAGTASSSTTVSDSSASVSGEATFYGGNLSGGTCSFTTYTLPSGMYGTAFSGTSWDSSECGACLQVTGPSGNSIKVMVVDECPECATSHLDLFQNAFEQLGSTSAGIINISYTPVACGITSPIVLHNKSGTSAYWFSMQVVNANYPVAKLEVSTDGGSTWKSTTRASYNFFENSSGFGTSTVDVRVTSTDGKSVTVSGVSVASEAQTTASANF